jgi:hypothetical protein
MACSAGGEDSVAQTSEAVKAGGAFHSHVTRQNWRHHVGHRHHNDDGHGCRPKSLDLCPTFDSDFIGVDAGASCAHITTPECPDRVDTWDSAIVFDFAIAVTSDCRFGEWSNGLLTDDDVINYLNDLTAFTLQVSGCPSSDTTTPLSFDLIPSALDNHKFTTADLDALVDIYSASVAQALSDNGSPALTARQAKELDAKLTQLARRVDNVNRSRKYTFSTCEPTVVGSNPKDSDDACR